MTTLLFGIGMVFILEGLVLALAPSFYDQVLETLANMPMDQRRVVGLVALGFGLLMVWMWLPG